MGTTESMRVGLFTESYDPIINGVSTSLKTLTAELVRSGHKPVVVAPQYPGLAIGANRLPEHHDDESNGVSVIRISAWRSPFNPDNPFAFPPVGAITAPELRSLKLDIVHTQQPFGMGMHGWAMAQRLNIPLVSTFHTLYTEYTHYFRLAPRALSIRVLNHLMLKHYASCATVVVPSREAGRRLERIGIPGNNLRVIPTGVSSAPVILPSAIEQARKDLQLPEHAPILLFVGRIAREKNLDLLLDAYDKFCQKWSVYGTVDRRPVLLIVGSGPYLDGCRRRVRQLGLEATVRFAGYISRDRLAPIYRLATLFCFPSLTETQGVVLSEAQSHGLPCIVANGGGAPEFVRPGVDALLVPNNADEFSEAIITLLENDARRRAFSVAARESPLRPSPTQMAERIMTVYAEVLGAVGKSSTAVPITPNP